MSKGKHASCSGTSALCIWACIVLCCIHYGQRGPLQALRLCRCNRRVAYNANQLGCPGSWRSFSRQLATILKAGLLTGDKSPLCPVAASLICGGCLPCQDTYRCSGVRPSCMAMPARPLYCSSVAICCKKNRARACGRPGSLYFRAAVAINVDSVPTFGHSRARVNVLGVRNTFSARSTCGW
jgi:hypothetical protein